MSNTVFLSLGLDIGTTTTHLVISRLTVGPGEDPFGRHHLLDKKIHYRSPIHRTPLLDPETIDADRIIALVEAEYRTAGVTRDDIVTGAVIITGETARKHNADAVVARLAGTSSTFAAAVAGANAEAVLAARGSGAAEWSRRMGVRVLNLDIGGGTTNFAWFDHGRLIDAAAIRVGGRHLIRGGPEATPYVVVTDAPRQALDFEEETLRPPQAARWILLGMRCCEHAVFGKFDEIPDALVVTRPRAAQPRPDVLFFSGGVGALMARLDRGADPDDLKDEFDDTGPELAMILRAISRLYAIPRQFPADPIRATVIGAGQFSTTLSGETLWIDPQRLPLTNLPVIHPFRTLAEMTDAATIAAALNHHRRLGDISDDTPVAVSLPPLRSADWKRIEQLAADLATAARSAPLPTPWVFTMADNYANLLGRTLTQLAPDTPCIVLDEIETETADYLDIGRPVEKERPVVPVIAKTLLFE